MANTPDEQKMMGDGEAKLMGDAIAEPVESTPAPKKRGPKSAADIENERLRIEIEELKKQLETAKAEPAPGSVVPNVLPKEQWPRWMVSFPSAPRRVVLAPDASNARQVYMREVGMLASIHSPVVGPVPDTEPLGDPDKPQVNQYLDQPAEHVVR